MDIPVKNSLKNKGNKIIISIIAALILLFFVFILFWVMFGVNQDKQNVSVKAALIKSGKTVNVYALEDCVILDFAISPEQFVEKDFVIARIEQIDIVSEINELLDKNPQDTDNIAFKRKELIERSLLLSPESGRVVETFVRAGDYVSKGTKIATIFKEAEGQKAMECLLFVPASKMANIQKGLYVNVYPSNTSVKIYGNLIGIVTYVSVFPVTKNNMITLLGSEALADTYTMNEAVYQVHVSLEMSEDSISGYKWTNSLGPSYKFGDLVLCDATIIIEE